MELLYFAITLQVSLSRCVLSLTIPSVFNDSTPSLQETLLSSQALKSTYWNASNAKQTLARRVPPSIDPPVAIEGWVRQSRYINWAFSQLTNWDRWIIGDIGFNMLDQGARVFLDPIAYRAVPGTIQQDIAYRADISVVADPGQRNSIIELSIYHQGTPIDQYCRMMKANDLKCQKLRPIRGMFQYSDYSCYSIGIGRFNDIVSAIRNYTNDETMPTRTAIKNLRRNICVMRGHDVVNNAYTQGASNGFVVSWVEWPRRGLEAHPGIVPRRPNPGPIPRISSRPNPGPN